MRSGKNPNREQKMILTANGKEWTEWLLTKTYVDTYEFKHKTTNEVITLSKTLPKKTKKT